MSPSMVRKGTPSINYRNSPTWTFQSILHMSNSLQTQLPRGHMNDFEVIMFMVLNLFILEYYFKFISVFDKSIDCHRNIETLVSFQDNFYLLIYTYKVGCCGATVSSLVSSARGPGFESHRGHKFLGLQV